MIIFNSIFGNWCSTWSICFFITANWVSQLCFFAPPEDALVSCWSFQWHSQSNQLWILVSPSTAPANSEIIFWGIFKMVWASSFCTAKKVLRAWLSQSGPSRSSKPKKDHLQWQGLCYKRFQFLWHLRRVWKIDVVTMKSTGYRHLYSRLRLLWSMFYEMPRGGWCRSSNWWRFAELFLKHGLEDESLSLKEK